MGDHLWVRVSEHLPDDSEYICAGINEQSRVLKIDPTNAADGYTQNGFCPPEQGNISFHSIGFCLRGEKTAERDIARALGLSLQGTIQTVITRDSDDCLLTELTASLCNTDIVLAQMNSVCSTGYRQL